MAVITYKCPNCGGELVFDPASQKYKCEYCVSEFTQRQLEEMTPAEGSERVDDTADEPAFTAEDGEKKNSSSSRNGSAQTAMVYTCPSCGAEVVTDETTAATFCYYCHNPVVLGGRLSGEYLPDKIIPFSIDRKSATEQFLKFVGKKKFVPKAFFNEEQIEKFSGVYYPYWIYDCDTDGWINAEATKVRTWRSGDTEYTETSIFQVERAGDITLKNIPKNALKKSDKALVNGVFPFRLGEAKQFFMFYLSGFLAEKRDMEKQEFTAQLHQETETYSQQILRDSITGYSTVNVQNSRINQRKETWNYLLLPVWVLTYAGRNGKVYYYTMNGQTGTIRGELPVDYKKLSLFSLVAGLIVAVVCMIGGYLV